jgi:mannan endo-1,4-beta-mannosidase
MIHRALVLFVTLVVLCASALAGSYCVIDPPRAASGSTGFYVQRLSASLASPSTDSTYRLFDPAGDEFRIHGVNRNHGDSYGTPTGLPLSGANAERIFLQSTTTPAYNAALVQREMVTNNIVPIPVIGWGATTCKTDPALLAANVDAWVGQASVWAPLSGSAIFNIANEWGPSTDVWRDSYITAVRRMRAAGYTGLLMVDAGGCGQDQRTVVNYGAQVLDADPLHNVVFGVHVYGSWHVATPTNPWQSWWGFTYESGMAKLRASGLPVVISEFGPMGVGPSQTPVPPERLIADAEAAGWGWMPWSWDDNNLQACASSDVGGFSLTKKCGIYTGDDANELTAWGRTIVPLLKASGARRALLSRP